MSNIVIAANFESALQSSLGKLAQDDIWSYSIDKNLPNNSKDVVIVKPNISPSGTFVNKNVTFKLPRYALTRGLLFVIKPTFAAGQTQINDSKFATRIYRDITIRTNNNAIFSQSPAYSLVRLSELPFDKAIIHNRLVNGTRNITVDAGQQSTYGLASYAPFFESDKMAIDLSYVEQIEVSCTINDLVGMGITADFSACEFECHMFNTYLSSQALEAYQSNQFGGESAKLVMLTYNPYNENSMPITNGTTTTTIDLKCPNSVTQTSFYIADSAQDLGPIIEIDGFTLRMAGRTIYENVERAVLDFDGARYGKVDLNVSNDGTIGCVGSDDLTTPFPNLCTIYHGQERSKTWNSGAISLTNTNGPQLTITHEDPGNTTHRLYVVHSYLNFLSINSGDGQLSVGNSY